MRTSLPQIASPDDDGPFARRVRARSEALERLRQDPIARSQFFAQLERLHKTGQITHESALLMQALAMPRCACGGPQQAVDADGTRRCPDCQSLATTGAPLPDEEPFYHLPFAGPADLEPLLHAGRI